MGEGRRKDEIPTVGKTTVAVALHPSRQSSNDDEKSMPSTARPLSDTSDPVTSWVIKRHYRSVSLSGADCISIDI